VGGKRDELQQDTGQSSSSSSSSSRKRVPIKRDDFGNMQQQLQPEQDFSVPRALLAKYLAACYISLDRYTSLDLSMTCWALAALRVGPPASFLSVFLRRVEQVRRGAGSVGGCLLPPCAGQVCMPNKKGTNRA